jgi:hypothetical protein
MMFTDFLGATGNGETNARLSIAIGSVLGTA